MGSLDEQKISELEKKCQQKFPKLKCKGKTKNNRTSKRCNIQVMGILEGKEYLKQ